MGTSVTNLMLLLGAALALGQCAPIPSPLVKPFADGEQWIVMEPLRYQIGQTAMGITVPAGFVTDFASVPQVLRSYISPIGRHGRAAIVHDYLYWEQPCSREEADKLFFLGMAESQVEPSMAVKIYDAVRLGGWVAWNSNADERARGLPRIIPQDSLNIPADALWPTYRAGLFARGIKYTPTEHGRPAYCDAGR